MPEELTIEAIETKLDKGEALTPEEEQFVMGAPAIEEPDKEIDLDKSTGISKEPEKEEEDTKTAEDEKKAEEEKAKADEALKKKAELEEKDKDIVNEVDKDLDKPDHQVNLSKYGEREKALYWELRRTRKRAQTAETERDVEKFNRLKLEKGLAEKPPEKTEEESEIADDDYLTGKQVKDIIKKQVDAVYTSIQQQQNQILYKSWEREARELYPNDYDAVMKLASSVVQSNPEALKEIKAAYANGDNVALVIYDFVKQDPTFGKLFADTANQTEEEKQALRKKAEQDKKAEETKKRLEENDKKPKTSGTKGAGGGGSVGEYTAQEIADMDDEEFARLPQKVRDKLLMEMA